VLYWALNASKSRPVTMLQARPHAFGNRRQRLASRFGVVMTWDKPPISLTTIDIPVVLFIP
jgi:hypothetical protein